MSGNKRGKENVSDIMERVLDSVNKVNVESLPSCSEKTLLTLQIKLAEHNKLTDNDSDSERYNMKPLLEQIVALEEQLNEESLTTQRTTFFCRKLKELLNKTQEQIEDYVGDYFESAFDTVTSLLGEIRYIDSNLLCYLLQGTLQASDRLIGKDVILVLGKTGTGKSTTIHFLGGSTLKLNTNTNTGRNAYEVVKYGNDTLKSFIVSHSSTSETIFINPVDFEYDGQVYTLCDSPGFNDNRGVEVDMSNALGITAAIKKCKSVRLLSLSSQMDIGNKLDGVIQDLTTYSLFIKDIQHHLNSFYYCFTKFPKADGNKISLMIEEKKKDIKKKGRHEDILAQLNNMSEKISKRNGTALILDPVKDNRTNILKEIIDTPRIDNPYEVFQNFATKQNLDLLKLQLSQHKQSIDIAINAKRFDIVQYKLHHLKTMQLVVDLPEFQETYNYCVSNIQRIVDSHLQRVLKQLNNFENEENNAIRDDLEACSKDMIELFKFESLRGEHFPSIPSFIDSCINQISNLCQVWYDNVEIKWTEFEKCKLSETFNYDSSLASRALATLRKINWLIEYFGERFLSLSNQSLSNVHSFNTKKSVESVIDVVVLDKNSLNKIYEYNKNSTKRSISLLSDAKREFEEFLQNFEFVKSLYLLQYIRILSKEWDHHNEKFQGNTPTSDITFEQRYFISARDSFIKSINDCYGEASRFLSDRNSQNLSEENIKEISKSFLLLAVLEEKKLWLEDIFNDKLSDITNANSSLSKTLKDFVVSVNEKITAEIAANTDQNSFVFTKLYEILSGLKNIICDSTVIDLIHHEYNDIVVTINGYIDSLREKLSKDILLMKSDHWLFDLKLFFHNLDVLKDSICLVMLEESFQNDYYSIIVEEFRQLLVLQEDKVDKTDLTYKNPRLVLSFVQIIKVMNELTEIAVNYQAKFEITKESNKLATTNLIKEKNLTTIIFNKKPDKNKCVVCGKAFQTRFLIPTHRTNCHHCNNYCHDVDCSTVKNKQYSCNNCTRIQSKISQEVNQNDNGIVSVNTIDVNIDEVTPVDEHAHVSMSLADIAKNIIDKFNEKIINETNKALLLFPSNIDSNYRINIIETWNAIEYILLIQDFKLVGIERSLTAIEIFAQNHFDQYRKVLNEKFETSVSVTSELSLRLSELSEMKDIIEYMKKLIQFYENNQYSLVNPSDAFHQFVFKANCNLLVTEWIEEKIPNVHDTIVQSKSKDYSSLSTNLVLAQAFSIMDSLILSSDKKFGTIVLELDNLVKEMSTSVQADIDNGLFDKVALFFKSQSDQETVRSTSTNNIITELTAKVSAKLNSLKQKVDSISSKSELNLSNSGLFVNLQNELIQLRLARDTILPYIDEPLKTYLPKDIEDIVILIYNALKAMTSQGNKDNDFETCERYFQFVMDYNKILLCDDSGKVLSDLKSFKELPAIIEENRKLIQKFIKNKTENLSSIFNAILSYINTDDSDKSAASLNIDRTTLSTEIKNKSVMSHASSVISSAASKVSNATGSKMGNSIENDSIKGQSNELLTSLYNQIKSDDPRMLINGLKGAAKIGESVFYNQQATMLEQLLDEKISNIIKLLYETIASNIKVSLLNTLNLLSPFLPDSLKAVISSNINSLNDKAKTESENAEREMKTNDFADILKQFRNYYSMKKYDVVIKGSLKLKRLLKESLDSYLKDLKNGNIITVLNNFPGPLEIYSEYIIICQSIGNSVNFNIRTLFGSSIKDDENKHKIFDIMEILSRKLYSTFNSIPEGKIGKIDRDIFKITSKSLDIIISLMSSYGIIQPHQSQFWDILCQINQTIRDDSIKAIVKIVNLIEEFNKLIDDELILEDISFSNLFNLLTIYKDSEDLIQKLRTLVIEKLNVEKLSIYFPTNLGRKIEEIRSYTSSIENIEKHIKQLVVECKVDFDYNLLLSPGSSIDCREYFFKLRKSISKLKSSEDIQSLTRIDLHTFVTDSENHIELQLSQLCEKGKKQQLIFDDLNNPSREEDDYITLNSYFNNFQNITEIFSQDISTKKIGNTSKCCLEDLVLTFKKFLVGYKNNLFNNRSTGTPEALEIIENLALLKLCSSHLDILQIYADKLIDDVLSTISDSTNIEIMQIITANQNNQYYQMLTQHKKFEESLAKVWVEVVSRFTIDQVLDREHGLKLSNNSISVKDVEYEPIRLKIKELYEKFENRYVMLINDGILGMSRTDQMKEIINYAHNAVNDRSKYFEEKILELMACLFAYWTLSKLKDSKLLNDGNDDDNFMDIDDSNSPNSVSSNANASHASILIKPHAGQIVAIFRIFGIDNPASSGKIDNHVIEILTGEGKSIILGITATIFALIGLSVDCVCYSSYLSNRDKESFKYLFTAFGVDEFINYGTLTELCEKTIEDRAGGNIRALTLHSFGTQSTDVVQRRVVNRPKVLLIDEVDVFFGEDFYGNVYTPVAKLVDQTITELVNFIWSLKSDSKKFNLNNVINSSQYLTCKQKFRAYEKVIEESVKYMFYQLKELLDDIRIGKEISPSHVPYVVGDSIGYKDQDSLSTQISLGYKTMWTYFIKNAEKKISDKSKNAQICIRLDCGQYSIAEVPKLYNHILGVSGTISALVQDKVLTETYNIHKETRIPSVYGKNKLKFFPIGGNADIKISTGASHFVDISNEVQERSDTGEKFHRPVLVFFESINELNKYYQCEQAKKFKSRTKILTEQENDLSKTNLIRNATAINTITLLTKEFGRGTDFIVYDERVRKAGGPHVIQTFFSEDISEEIQIKGRSARQGGEGSYSMVLSSVQLEKFAIFQTGSDSVEQMVRTGDYGDILNKKRLLFIENKRGGMKVQVDNFMPQHIMSLEFIQTLISKDSQRTCDYLSTFNKCPDDYSVNSDTRILVLMDATGSMCGCITNAKNAVGEMFKQVQDILRDNNVESKFEIQFAVYRNYNAPMEKIIEWSDWTSDPIVLYDFISKIVAAYGLGNEAVEVGFWHLNREMDYSPDNPIDRVILIGDCPPNTSDEVREKRINHHGELYWINTKLGPAFTYTDQLQEIKQKNEKIMINTFYLNGTQARPIFESIARDTGGICKSLDVQDVTAAAKFLCGHTATNVLDAINNNSTSVKKGELVAAYKQKFKGYYD